jgi:hypothetical protein
LQNNDTLISLAETFEVSRALQKKIQIECGKEKRAADLLSAALGFGCAAIARTGAPPSRAIRVSARRRRERISLSLADASKRESAPLEMANLC